MEMSYDTYKESLPMNEADLEVQVPRCKEAAECPTKYSRHRVPSPLVVLRAWHKNSLESFSTSPVAIKHTNNT